MQRTATRAAIMMALLTTAACSQAPAQVELKGQNDYAQNNMTVTSARISGNPASQPAGYVTGSSNYTPPDGVYANHPVSNATSNTAGEQSIGVSDLPPPPKSGSTGQHSENVAGKPHKEQIASVQVDKVSSKPRPMTLAQNNVVQNGAHASHGYIWPVSGTKVISGFGPKGAGKANDGINIAAADGEPVWAAADGEVVYVGDGVNGYGNMILIRHAGDRTSTYAHLSRATVDKYDRVKQGDIIGYVGTTGDVKDPQLHFAIRDGNTPVDPRKYLATNVASN